VVITPVKCPASTTTNCTIKDADIQTELLRQINTLKTLPTPDTDCTGNTKTIYMIHFPANVLIRDRTIGNSCAAGGFCAYHNTGNYTATVPLLYGAMMDEYSGGCATGCGTNSTNLANTTETASHELAEAATDADVGLATAFSAPLGWYDTNCGEVGDICDDGVSKGDTITVSGRNWTVQQLWSQKQHKCTSTGPAKTCPAGYVCGSVSDSCDGTINCGTCSGGDSCNAPTCDTTAHTCSVVQVANGTACDGGSA
jgi:hypothetical protein